MIVSLIVTMMFALLIKLHPDINDILERQRRQAQLDSTFNQLNYTGTNLLVGLDQTKQHEKYHGCGSSHISESDGHSIHHKVYSKSVGHTDFEDQKWAQKGGFRTSERLSDKADKLCIEEAEPRHHHDHH